MIVLKIQQPVRNQQAYRSWRRHKLSQRIINGKSTTTWSVLFFCKVWRDKEMNVSWNNRPCTLLIVRFQLRVFSIIPLYPLTLKWLRRGPRDRVFAFLLLLSRAIFPPYFFVIVTLVIALLWAIKNRNWCVVSQLISINYHTLTLG